MCSWCEGGIENAPFHLPGLPGTQCWLHFLVSSTNRERPGEGRGQLGASGDTWHHPECERSVSVSGLKIKVSGVGPSQSSLSLPESGFKAGMPSPKDSNGQRGREGCDPFPAGFHSGLRNIASCSNLVLVV